MEREREREREREKRKQKLYELDQYLNRINNIQTSKI